MSEVRGETYKELNPDKPRKPSSNIGGGGHGLPTESGPVEPPVINPSKSKPLKRTPPELL